jgi:hypothetical protein
LTSETIRETLTAMTRGARHTNPSFDSTNPFDSSRFDSTNRFDSNRFDSTNRIGRGLALGCAQLAVMAHEKR